MTGPSTTTQQQAQQSQTNPWQPAQGNLQGLLQQLGGISPTASPTQTAALNKIQSNANSAPDYTNPANGFLSSMFTNAGPAGTVAAAGNNLTSELTPYASGSMVGNNKALQGQLDVAGNDEQNRIEGQFAAAGRPVGTNADSAQAIARGVTQAQAPIIANQYNNDVSHQMEAANQLFGGTVTGATTQGALGGAALSGAQQIPTIMNQNPTTAFNAATTQQQIPLGLLQQLTSMTGGIAGLGGQNSGTSTGTTQQQQDPLSTLLGAGLAGAGLAGKFLPSDERIKEDIRPIGMLADGQIIHKYRYRADPAGRTHIGLLAQEVERWHPEAVAEFGGVKHVNYDAATADASSMAA